MSETADTAPDFPGAALTEDLAPDWGIFVRPSRSLENFRSPFQAIEVHDTAAFGKLFRLDGHFMTSENDEFFYHENLVHFAALSHPAPRHALVIGGGDGGSAEELLKHPSIQAVTVCEIDAAVVEHRPQAPAVGASRCARRSARDAEHRRWLRISAPGRAPYDLIVLDLTDPAARRCRSTPPSSIAAARTGLHPSGALTLHVGSPVAHAGRIRAVLARLREAFPRVTPYLPRCRSMAACG